MPTVRVTPDQRAADLPEANRPGHHPEVEQDKPSGPPPAGTHGPQRFDFAFEPWAVPLARAVGVSPSSAWVEVDDDVLTVRFGPWSMVVPRDEITGVQRSGPYRPWKVLGPPHLSLADRGITFGTNHRAGVCLDLRRPLSGIEPLGWLRHPGVTLTVADPDGLVHRLTVGR